MKLNKVMSALGFGASVLLGVSSASAQMCGDTITGSVTLGADLPCSSPTGLTLALGAKLDMNGHALECTVPSTVGIAVGGGAKLSNGVIKNCHHGVVANADGVKITNVVSWSNTGTGLQVTGNGNKLTGCAAIDSRENGIMVAGSGIKVTRCTAVRSGQLGIADYGTKTKLTDNVVYDFNTIGLHSAGQVKNNTVHDPDGIGQIGISTHSNKATGNVVVGIAGSPGTGFDLQRSNASENVAVANSGAGFVDDTLGSTIEGNLAAVNGGRGFDVSVQGALLEGNRAIRNLSDGFGLVGLPENPVLASGNIAVGNQGNGISLISGPGEITENVALLNGLKDLADNNSATCANSTWAANVANTTLQGCEN